jgi:oxygen-dependent protoporphyrinogen oxidase
MGITAEPDFVKTFRHHKSIPQYNVGHAGRLATIERLLVNYPNLVLTGNAYKGVALNDCVANAYQLASSLK